MDDPLSKITRILRFQVLCKRDPEMELRAQVWIESVLNEKFSKPFEDALKVTLFATHILHLSQIR